MLANRVGSFASDRTNASMKKIAIAMTHGHTPKWLQTVLASLKRYKNEAQFDIYVALSWPEHPSVRAATETSLGDGVTFLDCTRRRHSHAIGLETILEHIRDMDYEYMFACETDCAAMQDGWLDWFVAQAQIADAGITGFFWHEGDHHFNINPSGTLYRMDMLLQYHDEARSNNGGMFYHPEGNKADTEPGMDPMIKEVAGVFSETRGIKDPTPEQLHYIEGGVPHCSWWEPGQWLYVRSRGEWNEARVQPCDHIYIHTGVVETPEGTYYGGKDNPQFIHYWGGTRAYDFLKHKVDCGFVKGGAPWWFAREDRIWRETVPQEFHEIVHKLALDADTEAKMRENMGFFVAEVM